MFVPRHVLVCSVLLVCVVSVLHGYKNKPNNQRRVAINGRRQKSSRETFITGQSKRYKYESSYMTSAKSAGKRTNESSRLAAARLPRRHSTRGQSDSSRRQNDSGRRPPNIIMVLTDDQDVLLGSLNYMPKVQQLLIKQGAYFNNSFVPTPMCCPSRSSMLTGMYVHNHNVYTNNANCSGPQWRKTYESRSFATYINNSHNTGYFGKYLNEYNGDHTPAGWRRWEGLVRNSRFYNYTIVNQDGVKTRHGDNYYKDYLTDLVAKDSLAFLKDSKRRDPNKPVMMVMSVPAPHGPEDAAPQYQHMFVNNTAHRTPAWNHAPNMDKQWLLKVTGKMYPQLKLFTDLLQRRRLQTLQSVDDMVEQLVDTLKDLRELDNTYIIYTSDHGYHLGQFGLIKGKAMPFDFDTRVPLIVRGPGITPGTIISNIVSNIDMAPTILDIAGQKIPDHMDGQSMLRLIKASRDEKNIDKRGFVTLKRPWRDTILFERGKLSEKIMKQRMRTEELSIYNQLGSKKNSMFSYIAPRQRKLAKECAKGQNRLPCQPDQKWYCIENNGRLRRHKCKNKQAEVTDMSSTMQSDAAIITEPCSCSKARMLRKLGRRGNRRQRRYLKNKSRRELRAKFVRLKRSASASIISSQSPPVSFSGFSSIFNRRCRILANQSVLCDLDIYRKSSEWETHKNRIDAMIKEYRKALEDLRDIRRHLKEQQPLDASDDIISNETDDWTDDDDQSCDCAGLEDGLTPAQRKRAREKEQRIRQRLEKKKTRKDKRKKKNDYCNNENMNCFTHDNGHWKTPPYWKYGPFCFCSNANNNTYWCLRTINQSHDFVYCEFITTFMSYYDLIKDPFQLNNSVTELNFGVIQQLHETLKKLKHCVGSKDCYLASSQQKRLKSHHDADWPGLRNLKKSSKRSSYNHSYFKHAAGRAYSDNVYDRKGKRLETRFSSNLDYE